MIKKTIWLISFLVILHHVHAQEENIAVQNVFKGTRLVNAQSANLAKQGELHMQIQHRFGDISGGMYELFGLDQASMRLGFEYGIGKNWDIGVGRSSMFKTYDASVKFRIANQSGTFPLTIVSTAEGSVPTIRDYFPESLNNFSDKFSGNVQFHVAKTIGIFGLQVTPGYLHTGYLLTEEENFDIFTLGFGASVKLAKKVSVNLEYLHHFEDELTANKPLSIGVDLDTGGHLFQIMVTNSQAMYNQALYTNTYGDWTKGHLYFGFNLIREFKLKYTDY